jgi:hypothetical protein
VKLANSVKLTLPCFLLPPTGNIAENANADVTTDEYHRYKVVRVHENRLSTASVSEFLFN